MSPRENKGTKAMKVSKNEIVRIYRIGNDHQRIFLREETRKAKTCTKRRISETDGGTEVFDPVNLNALASLCRLFGADMARQKELDPAKRKYILNIASYSVYMPIEGFGFYAGSKAFVRIFSKCFAKEMRHAGVKVTAVAPAGMDTTLMGLKPGIQKLARATGFLASPDRIARISIRAMKTRCIGYWIPGWYNMLFIPFLWLFQPVFNKVL